MPCEWIGGRISAPFYVEDGPEPYRPDLILWLEEPSGLVVGQDLAIPGSAESDGALSRSLRKVLEQPMAGPARRPDSIRVATRAFAAEIRAALGNAIPVRVAPTPEIAAVMQVMLESMPGPEADESYLDAGRISSEVIASLFGAAKLVYQLAPWEVATDDQVLRLDIPALDLDGACLSMIGNLGESLGLMIFPSYQGYDAFVLAAEQRDEGETPAGLDFGTGWLGLNFERGAELPTSMRREVAAHGWPVADASAYPLVTRYERDGVVSPPSERDYAIAAACATSLCAFFANHRSLFEADEFKPVCETYTNEDDLEVRLTIPYEALPFFEFDDAPATTRGPAARPTGFQPASGPVAVPPFSAPQTGRTRGEPGRNAPCPCGSGRKYKKCCLVNEQKTRAVLRERESLHELDHRLLQELTEYAYARFGIEWQRFTNDFFIVEEVLEIAIAWSVYHYEVAGQSALEAYLTERPRRLTATERSWLEAQRASWLSIWEVSEVDPGVSITLRDLLTYETRFVPEVSGSQNLLVHDVLLARIVDYQGNSILCGSHPNLLPPTPAAEVERRARGRLRRKRQVPLERVRDEAFGRYLIKRWEEAVEDYEAMHEEGQAALPQLQNTDGDPMLLTADHFKIRAGARGEVGAKIAALQDVEASAGAAAEDPQVYVFLRPGNRALQTSWQNTLIGRATLFEATLKLETNSQARADALRHTVEAACGDLIAHRAREHADPLSERAALPERSLEAEPLPPEAEQMLLEFKQRHYAEWPDFPLPALDGKTPREAVHTVRGRGAVDVLIKEMEQHEQRAHLPMPRSTKDGAPDSTLDSLRNDTPSQPGQAFDFSELRRELGLDPALG